MIISIIGLIGSGKSTLASKLACNNHYTMFEEPVNNNPFLNDYYKDPSRWSFTLQVYYFWERYKQAQEAFMRSLRGETVILDSSLYSDFAFATLQYDEGYFTKDEYDTYFNMHKIITAQTAYPDLTIWLRITPDQALERIKKRSRECESDISIEYLNKLHSSYRNVIESLKKRSNIISIDATQNANVVYENTLKVINNYRNQNSYLA